MADKSEIQIWDRAAELPSSQSLNWRSESGAFLTWPKTIERWRQWKTICGGRSVSKIRASALKSGRRALIECKGPLSAFTHPCLPPTHARTPTTEKHVLSLSASPNRPLSGRMDGWGYGAWVCGAGEAHARTCSLINAGDVPRTPTHCAPNCFWIDGDWIGSCLAHVPVEIGCTWCSSAAQAGQFWEDKKLKKKWIFHFSLKSKL